MNDGEIIEAARKAVKLSGEVAAKEDPWLHHHHETMQFALVSLAEALETRARLAHHLGAVLAENGLYAEWVNIETALAKTSGFTMNVLLDKTFLRIETKRKEGGSDTKK